MFIVFGYSTDICAEHLPFRVVYNLRERGHPFTLSEYYTARLVPMENPLFYVHCITSFSNCRSVVLLFLCSYCDVFVFR